MTEPTETISIENVVASTAIGQELDLEQVAMDLEGADYMWLGCVSKYRW